MKERFPSLIALFLLAALVLGTWWAADYTQRAIVSDPPKRYTHEMDSWSRDLIMLRTDPEGKPINRLEGDYAEHYPDDDSYVITNPRAIGQRPDSPVTVATGRQGTMYQGGKRIVLDGDAHLHRPAIAAAPATATSPAVDASPAIDVRSEQLTVLPDDDLITTDLPALVTRGDSRMNGRGMKYNDKTRQLEIHSAANVEIAPADTQRANRDPGAADDPNHPSAKPAGKADNNAKPKQQP
jgi:lipopolysaccharide export system protein LptC